MFEQKMIARAEAGIGGLMSRDLTLTERLRSEKESLERRLAEVNECLSALEAQPSLQGVIDLIFRTVR